MAPNFFAHVKKKDNGLWAEPHLLSEHLSNTAYLAEQNAAKFKSGMWGKAAGLLHDVGKGRLIWQEYLGAKSGYYDEDAHLEGSGGKLPHAIHGAKLAEYIFGKEVGRLLAYCIAGHHAGLPDWSSAYGEGRASLDFQMSQDMVIGDIDSHFIDLAQSVRPAKPPWGFDRGLDLSLWIRMIYSCLVDADFLDTESYMQEEIAPSRGGYASISELWKRFNIYIKKFDNNAALTEVNRIRKDIRSRCIQMASDLPGIFSLSVPTGGGKTLSSLAFALEHARKYNLDRIIYVIPYTSIIEQNADVFRRAIGDDQVVEHHSSLAEDEWSSKARLASENWDAPIIVTTSVQFFESLFAVKSSRCRKLHNIARSVVVLDEAQLLPVHFLRPILESMQLLVDHYQVTFLISTATQPAFRERTIGGEIFRGLRNVKEIMGERDEVQSLYKSLERCRIVFPDNLNAVSSWEEIAEDLKQWDQVLCIVSDRKSCRELHRLMPEGTIHLSALMCGQHRTDIVSTIKQRLQDGERVRVISTQLVEAGVDFDFPVVYRAMAGIDSIVQAAGRCNREGKSDNPGKVIVFTPPRRPPMGILRKAAETTIGILTSGNHDLQDCNTYEKYFSELYWRSNSLDRENIISLLKPDTSECSISFRTAASKFRIIDDSLQKTILIPYKEGERLIDLLKSIGPSRWLMRRLQRYTVNIYNNNFAEMSDRGAIVELFPGVFILRSSIDYSNEIGLETDTRFDPEDFII